MKKKKPSLIIFIVSRDIAMGISLWNILYTLVGHNFPKYHSLIPKNSNNPKCK